MSRLERRRCVEVTPILVYRSQIPARFVRRTAFPFITLLIAAGFLVLWLLSQPVQTASAAAPPVTQCNSVAATTAGQGLECTVTIINHVNGDGTLDDSVPSTVAVTVCSGEAGPVGAGGVVCDTTTTISVEPVTLVQQCNGSVGGGGGVLLCNVVVINRFNSPPAAEIEPATVYQCVGSVITGSGAPGICTPANTPGVTSIGAATVGQCNGSGNGGTNVGFVCTVTAGSTTVSTLEVHIDQCNGSANGGGALVICRASATNQVLAAQETTTASATAPGGSTPTGTPTPAGAATGTPIGSLTTTPVGTSTATATPSTASPTPTGSPIVTVTPTRSVTPAPTGSPTSTPSASPTSSVTSTPGAPGTSTPSSGGTPSRPQSTPRPPAAGAGAAAEGDQTSMALMVLMVALGTFGFGLATRQLLARRTV